MAENEIWDNYRFIPPARASHFRFVSKTISIPKDLGCQCDWRTWRSWYGILDLLKGRDLVPKGFGLTQRKKFGEKCIGAFLPGWHCVVAMMILTFGQLHFVFPWNAPICYQSPWNKKTTNCGTRLVDKVNTWLFHTFTRHIGTWNRHFMSANRNLGRDYWNKSRAQGRNSSYC
jgi:hypothetical protein